MHMYVRRSVLSKHFPLIAPAAYTIRFECLRKQGYKKKERVLEKKKKRVLERVLSSLAGSRFQKFYLTVQ